MTIREDGRATKKIPWTAFSLTTDDWRQVADAWDIPAVHPRSFLIDHSIYFAVRTQIESNNASHRNIKPCFGMLSNSLRTFKTTGKKNVMAKQAMNASLCTVLLSKMDSTSSRNTTASLMRSLLMFLLCICPRNSLISFTKQFKLFVLQSFTCILSLNTLNWHGVENQNKQLSEQRGF